MELSTFSPEHPLLLITDYPADTGGGGAVILRSLLSQQEREKVIWLSLSGATQSDPALWKGHHRLTQGSSGMISSARRSIFLDSTWFAGNLAAEILDIAKERQARGLWVVMHGAVVHVAAHLIRAGQLPIHLTVHDDPTSYIMRSKKNFVLTPLVERDLAFALKKADSIDVICQGMAQRYKSRYGVDSTIVHRGTNQEIEPETTYDKNRFGLAIGVLGNTYSYEQLPILCQAIIEASRQLGVPGKLVIVGQSFGDRLQKHFSGQLDIDVANHLDETTAIERLRQCFMLYLNYPFSWRTRVLRQTSFPTKLSTYLMTARPIIMHVPDDSSVMPLANYSGYINLWNNCDPMTGAKILIKCWSESKSEDNFHIPAENIRQKYYDLNRNQENLFKLLNALT
ncbi:hypothetical protein [Anabaena sp. UHCC 0451]|uniref:hypothetical protein n=1 Tax=Anabaena sp. UHCC 0451 TaxID=2055235 RepID=UPI002B209EA3|nr:hypothetical protein [Anabaena sp. UHCC 0451]MEA5575966.1 hypothetical protein [Anabaena sp. UHCC 0451]